MDIDSIIKAILSYVPVTQPRRPRIIIQLFFMIIHGDMSDILHLTASSRIGGKIKARAVELMAPTNEMKRPK